MKRKMKKKSSFSFFNVARLFGYLLVFALPFQVNVFIGGYSGVFFNPYLSHFLWVGDLALACSVLFVGVGVLRGEKFDFRDEFRRPLTLLLGLFVLIYVLSFLFSVNIGNSAVYFLRAIEGYIVYLLISTGFLNVKKVMEVFVGVMVAQAVIGILQFCLQGSVGLWLLGESFIGPDVLNVAKFSVFGENVMRAYGTFPHPNVFGGFLVVAIFLSLYLRNEQKRLFSVLLIFLGVGLILTFSRSAMLALVIGLVGMHFLSNKKVSLKYFVGILFGLAMIAFLFLLKGDAGSLSDRVMYLSTSANMFIDNFFGVGAGNFTYVMQHYSNSQLMPWLFQPVHNIFLLALNELGVGGFLILLFVMAFILKLIFLRGDRITSLIFGLWLALVIIGLFDHYQISLYQGQMLLWLLFGMASRI